MKPCKHFIQSRAFAQQFSRTSEIDLYEIVIGYCSANRGGPLGSCNAVLTDDNGDEHVFYFETFSFHHNVLTLGLHMKPNSIQVLIR